MTGAIVVADDNAGAIGPVMAVMARAFDPRHGEAWTQAQCTGTLLLPGTWLSVARDDTRVVGFAIARTVLDEAELMMLGVDPAVRGRGIGTLLVERFAEAAARRGARRLHLEVREGNPAIRLYQRHRFIPVGRREAYYRGSEGAVFAAITLSRPLS